MVTGTEMKAFKNVDVCDYINNYPCCSEISSFGEEKDGSSLTFSACFKKKKTFVFLAHFVNESTALCLILHVAPSGVTKTSPFSNLSTRLLVLRI